MASDQTKNYGLNQWERTDKVVMEDFNADNAKVDAALAEKAEASAVTALQAAVAKKAERSALTALQTTVNGKASQSALNALQTTVNSKGNCRVELGSYVGTGVAPVSLKTSFPPKALIIMSGRLGFAVRPSDRIVFISDNTRYGTITWTNTGLSWVPGTVANTGQWNNMEDNTYYYVVFG